MLTQILNNKNIDQLENGIYTAIDKANRSSAYDEKVKEMKSVGNMAYMKG